MGDMGDMGDIPLLGGVGTIFLLIFFNSKPHPTSPNFGFFP